MKHPWNLGALGDVLVRSMRRAVHSLVLAATLSCAACTSTKPARSMPTTSEAPSHATKARLQPCSLVSKGLVEATLPGTVTRARKLAAHDFLSPPPRGFVSCAYETDSRYGQLTVSLWPMARAAYELGKGGGGSSSAA
jgi:hypothetical protein